MDAKALAADHRAGIFLPDLETDTSDGLPNGRSPFLCLFSVEQLAQAVRLGKLGEQIVVKSKFAFSRLKFEGAAAAEKERYYALRKARDDEANRCYLDMLEEESDGLYIQDIMRGGIGNDDPRIPRNLSE